MVEVHCHKSYCSFFDYLLLFFRIPSLFLSFPDLFGFNLYIFIDAAAEFIDFGLKDHLSLTCTTSFSSSSELLFLVDFNRNCTLFR